MNKNEKNTILITLFCLLGTYLITFTNNFPYFGFAVFIIGLAFYVMYFKNVKDSFSKFLINSIMILATFMVIRSNETVLFLNTLAIFCLGALVSLQFTKDFKFRVLEVLLAPIVIFFDSLTHKNNVYDIKELKQGKFSGSTQRLQEISKGVAISLVVLIFILPLLSEANPFFSNLISIDIVEFIETVFGPNSVFKIIVFTFLMIFIPRLLSRVNDTETDNIQNNQTVEMRQISVLLPKIITAITLIIFVVTQLQLYLATNETLDAMGYTSAVKTREVFSQLTVVSLIILLLIFKDKSKEKLHQYTSYVLAFLTAFLISVALKSDLDNISNWGFTHTRLYGLVFLAWISGMLVITMNNYRKNLEEGQLVRKAIVLSVLLLGLVNAANFDQLIWKYGQYGTENGADNYYLSRLSPDAGSYKEHLAILMAEIQKPTLDTSPYGYDLTSPAWNIVNQIQLLRMEYQGRVPVRGFNLSRYLEYLDTRTVNIAKVEAVLANTNEIYYKSVNDR